MCHRDEIWDSLVLTRLDDIIEVVIVIIVVIVVVVDNRRLSEAWPVVDADMFVDTTLSVAGGK